MAATGKPAGTRKYVNTPVGQFEIPQGVADALGRMSSIELMREYIEKCRDFIDPFLFQEMVDRGLIHRGDFHSNIETRLREMEKGLALIGPGPTEEDECLEEDTDGPEIG